MADVQGREATGGLPLSALVGTPSKRAKADVAVCTAIMVAINEGTDLTIIDAKGEQPTVTIANADLRDALARMMGDEDEREEVR